MAHGAMDRVGPVWGRVGGLMDPPRDVFSGFLRCPVAPLMTL